MTSLFAPPASTATRLGVLLVLAAALVAGFLPLRPPAVLPEDAPPTAFSAARALRPLRIIAAAPRPVGTAQHAQVRGFLRAELAKQGLEVEEQEAEVFGADAADPLYGGRVHNVLARRRGTDEAHEAVLVVAHYDSVPTGPGASDNGAAVAAVLEAARALRDSPPLRNDVLFLLTDAEELRLLGAQAFLSHPWARQAKVALNFDARGSGGVPMMFETSSGNGWLVRQLAAVVPLPLGNSLSYEVYKLMPNSTDFTVLRRAGLAGLNFGHIEQALGYHSHQDEVDRLDARTLQYQGEAMLGLVRQLGGQDLSKREAEDLVYFDAGPLFVHHAQGWTWALLGLAVVLGVAAGRRGARHGHLRAGGVARALLAWVLTVVGASVLTALFWWGLRSWDTGYGLLPEGMTYSDRLFLLGFTALTLGLVLGTALLLLRRMRLAEVAAAGALLWFVPGVLTSFLLPGASYFFLWPLLGGLAGLHVLITRPAEQPSPSPFQVLGMGLGAVPTVLIATPIVFSLYVALTLSMAGAVAVFLALLLLLLAPCLAVLLGRRGLPAATAAALVTALALLGAGAWEGTAFSAVQPSRDSAMYLLDVDTGTARWISSDPLRDGWLSGLMGETAQPQRMEDHFPDWPGALWTAPAKALPLVPPTVEVVRDELREGLRTVKLRIASPRGAPLVDVLLAPETKPVELELAGRGLDAIQRETLAHRRAVQLLYWAAATEGFELTLRLRPGEPLRLRVSDQSFELPSPDGQPHPRSPGTIPVAFYDGIGEGTRVTRTLSL